jgi:hypothetical protein
MNPYLYLTSNYEFIGSHPQNIHVASQSGSCEKIVFLSLVTEVASLPMVVENSLGSIKLILDIQPPLTN